MSATLDTYADTLRQMGYAIEADAQAITLPGHWRVYEYGRWWVLCYWLGKGKRACWERYGLYCTLQEAVEKGLEL